MNSSLKALGIALSSAYAKTQKYPGYVMQV